MLPPLPSIRPTPLGYLCLILSICVIIDSIVAIVGHAADYRAGASNRELGVLVLMSVRLAFALGSMFGVAFNSAFVVGLYGLTMLAELFLLQFVINYRHLVLSLALQLAATYVAVGVAFETLSLRLGLSDDHSDSLESDRTLPQEAQLAAVWDPVAGPVFGTEGTRNSRDLRNPRDPRDLWAPDRTQHLDGATFPSQFPDGATYLPESPPGGEKVEEPSDSAFDSALKRLVRVLSRNSLAAATLATVAIAIGLGILIRYRYGQWRERELKYLEYPGEIYLRMLKCLIIPLIISSLISALGNLDTKLAGKIGGRAVLLYVLTTVVAIVLGIVLVVLIKPGEPSDPSGCATGEVEGGDTVEARNITTIDSILDLGRNLFPENIIQATFATYLTTLTERNASLNESMSEWAMGYEYGPGMNILGLVMFSTVLGIVIGQMGEAGQPLLHFFNSLSDSMMRITEIVIRLTPVGVLFLVMPRIVQVDDVGELLRSVGTYAATVMAGLAIHGLLLLPLLYLLLVRKNPIRFFLDMSAVIMTSFGTSSSSATIPVTIKSLEDLSGLDSRVVRFCIPVGATLNMNGTALYEAVAALFISQVRCWSLSPVQIVLVSITATAASVGAAGIPQAGLVTMVIVLQAVGLPVEDVALIFVVDWFLDRFRTVINVLGDCFVAAIVNHLSRSDL